MVTPTVGDREGDVVVNTKGECEGIAIGDGDKDGEIVGEMVGRELVGAAVGAQLPHKARHPVNTNDALQCANTKPSHFEGSTTPWQFGVGETVGAFDGEAVDGGTVGDIVEGRMPHSTGQIELNPDSLQFKFTTFTKF